MNEHFALSEQFAASQEIIELSEWRERTLVQLLRVVLTLAIIGGIAYAYFAWGRGPSTATFVNAFGIVMISIALLVRRLPYSVRAFCIVIVPYVAGTAALFNFGTLTLLYFVAFPILGAIFIGAGFAAAATVLATLTLLIGGQYTGWQPVLGGIASSRPVVTWAVLAFDYACIASGLTFACAILLRKVEMSLKTQKLAAHSVELRQEEITRLKRELETARRASSPVTARDAAAKEFSNPFM